MIKIKICPLSSLEEYVPVRGAILDYGCGIGIFDFILASRSEQRHIVAYDVDNAKIEIAKKANNFKDRLKFEHKAEIDLPYNTYDSVIISDVLYLLPFNRQEEIIKDCFAKLKDKGTLIIKEVDTKPRWKYMVNYLQETISVKIIGLTKGNSFYFRSSGDYEELLRNSGFAVKMARLDSGYIYPHTAYIGTKSSII